jgi:tripartite ATP-independent transporter DctP family solute receptor
MRKICVVLFVLILALPSVFAGGEAEESKSSSSEPIQILLGATAAATMDDPEYASLVKFQEEAKALSGGRIQVLLFPANQLGKINEIIEGVSLGTIQACQVGFDSVSALYLPAAIFSLPYTFRDIPHMQRVIASEPGQEMLDQMSDELGIMLMSVLYRGPRHVMNSKRPVVVPADLNGLKIRTPANPLNQGTLTAMGATAVAIDWSEIYTALTTGIVDGYENPIDILNASKGYETCGYLSLTGHMQSPIPLFINTEFFDGLEPELQEAVMGAAKAAEDYRLELLKTSEDGALATFKAAGVEINEVDFDAFAEATKDVYKTVGISDSLLKEFRAIK